MDPALRELLRGDDNDEIQAIIRLQDGVPENVRIVARFGNIATCRLRRGSIVITHEAESVASLKAPRLLIPEPTFSSDHETTQTTADTRRPPHLGVTGKGIVIGVIDWGIDFAHVNFRNLDGSTRLLALWDQSAPMNAKNHYGYGVIHRKKEIDQALKTAHPYKSLGYHPYLADSDGSGTHGTHVMDTAAGNGRAGSPVGIAPEADLIFVHLDNVGHSQNASLGNSVALLEALDFIVRTAGDQPCVINMSMGRHGGPHDGSTLVEQGMDALLSTKPGLAIVQSAGNYFASPIHSAGQVRPGQSIRLTFDVDAADVTPNEIEVWYSGRDVFGIMLIAPDGQHFGSTLPGKQTTISIQEREVGQVYHRIHDPNNTDNHVDIFLYPGAPGGKWTLQLTGVDIVDGRFDAWIERDAACNGCQIEFDSDSSSSQTTTGSICNGFRTIAVGAYDGHSKGWRPASFSSAGPTRDGRVKPDLIAPGVSILAARSASSGKSTHDQVTRKSGTSMAAPHVTGTIALMFEAAGQPLHIHETRNLLLGSTTRKPPDIYRYGNGYLDIESAVMQAYASQQTEINAQEESMTIWNNRSRRPNTLLNEAIRPVQNETPNCDDCGDEEAYNALPSPTELYDAFAGEQDTAVDSYLEEQFIRIAAPGEEPELPILKGDILVRRSLGNATHLAVIASPKLWRCEEARAAGIHTESERPGGYVVVEDKTKPYTTDRCLARRLVDSDGHILRNQVVLRQREIAETESVADSKLSQDVATYALGVTFTDGASINKYFTDLTGKDFIDWFNATCARKKAWANMTVCSDKGSGDKAISVPKTEIPALKKRFNDVWDNIPMLFGTSSINLIQFSALMSIFINEVGNLIPVSEHMNSIKHSTHPGIAYAFDNGGKQSYNVPNGAYSKTAWELFQDQDFVDAHGDSIPTVRPGISDPIGPGASLDARWNGKSYPKDRYPVSTDPAISGAILETDFYKFRGRGLIQTTFRVGYKPIIEFIQSYTGTNVVIQRYKKAWKGMSPDKVATISTNSDWDTLFQKTDLIIPVKAINLHNKSRGNYLKLATDLDTLNSINKNTIGSIFVVAHRIAGGECYARKIFRPRVVQILEAVYDAASSSKSASEGWDYDQDDESHDSFGESTPTLSGGDWVKQFPGSTKVGDLDQAFQTKLNLFISALRSAGATIAISSTYRPPERAYMMHWAWLIAKESYDARKVPPMQGVDIEWWHGDQKTSEKAAWEMVVKFGITDLEVAPALRSRHTSRQAIDMKVYWNGDLNIKQKDGRITTITSTPRNHTNPDLIAIAATYGVIHFQPVHKDKVHWSTDGR